MRARPCHGVIIRGEEIIRKTDMSAESSPRSVVLSQATKIWAYIAAMSFGGPAGQISLMHRTLVDEQNWLGEKRFLHALNYCMLLPGPEAQQLATYIGWLMHGVRGGLIAGGLFILPGFLSILVLSILYSELGQLNVIEGLFFGLQAAVLGIIVHALINIAKRVLHNRLLIGVAIISFIGIFLLGIGFPIIVLGAALLGYLAGKAGWQHFFIAASHGDTSYSGTSKEPPVIDDVLPAHALVNKAWSIKIGLIFLTLWLVPIIGLTLLLGQQHVFSEIALFFSKMAVVSFGGAYAVLAYVAQEGVAGYGWLTPAEMLDGLGMAETTPGPLIQVVQFVGYLGGYREALGLPSVMSGLIAAVITTWVTFMPCFLWIFVGAPYVETLRKNQQISAALTAVTAAVVGVILNLAIWFAIHALFEKVRKHEVIGLTLELPTISSVDLGQLTLCGLAFIMTFGLKLKTFTTLSVCAVVGMLGFAL